MFYFLKLLRDISQGIYSSVHFASPGLLPEDFER